MIWMIDHQDGQRNPTQEQLVYLRGKRYELEKAAHGGTGANRYTKEQSRQNDDSVKTSKKTVQKLAEQYNVAPRTIKRDAKVAKAIDAIDETSPVAKQKILAGEVDINKTPIIGLLDNHSVIFIF